LNSHTAAVKGISTVIMLFTQLLSPAAMVTLEQWFGAEQIEALAL